MKVLFLTLGLIGTTALAHAQGTIAWGLSRIIIAPLGGRGFTPTAEDGFSFTLFYGPDGSTAEQLIAATPPAFIGSVPGSLSGAASVFALPATEPGQTVSLQVRATHPAGISMQNPPMRQVTLGPTAGPGTVILFTDPNTRTFIIVPEPTTIVLAAAGGLLFAITRWKSW